VQLMLNVYYFFSSEQPPYLPTELEVAYPRKHCVKSTLHARARAPRKTPHNIVKVPLERFWKTFLSRSKKYEETTMNREFSRHEYWGTATQAMVAGCSSILRGRAGFHEGYELSSFALIRGEQ
jgi:hypothetical protein